MANTVKVRCENSGSELHVTMGSSLQDLALILSLRSDHPFLAAYVNNSLEDLNYKIFRPISIRYIDITHFEGMRVYQRTLFFTLNKAISDLFPQNYLNVRHSVSKGFYCELNGMSEVSDEQIDAIKKRMEELIKQDVPIVKGRILTEELEAIYTKLGVEDKLSLIRSKPRLYSTIYSLADTIGYMFGEMAVSTNYITLFGITKYYHGFYVAIPKRTEPTQLEKMVPQEKMFDIFTEYKFWVEVMKVSNVGSINNKVSQGESGDLIKVAEALHERKFAKIADQIVQSSIGQGTKVVTIAGPSSSGKTTFAKRLGIQLRIFGLEPVLLSLDDYFVDRDKTPLDKSGEYDYESIYALDLQKLNDNFKALIDGESAKIPKYDFITGKSGYHSEPLKLGERSILIIEGIHGLNPILLEQIDKKYIYKVYISALTSVSMDNLSRISTTDNRLLRRMVRDHDTRGADATSTLRRWASVRSGEDNHIFPFQENADMMFNSSLFYEISILRRFAEPLLLDVPDTVPEYGEARRLLKFLANFIPIDPTEIPPTSIMREFIGGSSFSY